MVLGRWWYSGDTENERKLIVHVENEKIGLPAFFSLSLVSFLFAIVFIESEVMLDGDGRKKMHCSTHTTFNFIAFLIRTFTRTPKIVEGLIINEM